MNKFYAAITSMLLAIVAFPESSEAQLFLHLADDYVDALTDPMAAEVDILDFLVPEAPLDSARGFRVDNGTLESLSFVQVRRDADSLYFQGEDIGEGSAFTISYAGSAPLDIPSSGQRNINYTGTYITSPGQPPVPYVGEVEQTFNNGRLEGYLALRDAGSTIIEYVELDIEYDAGKRKADYAINSPGSTFVDSLIYSYDAQGRLMQLLEYGGFVGGNNPISRFEYQYPSNQLTELTLTDLFFNVVLDIDLYGTPPTAYDSVAATIEGGGNPPQFFLRMLRTDDGSRANLVEYTEFSEDGTPLSVVRYYGGGVSSARNVPQVAPVDIRGANPTVAGATFEVEAKDYGGSLSVSLIDGYGRTIPLGSLVGHGSVTLPSHLASGPHVLRVATTDGRTRNMVLMVSR